MQQLQLRQRHDPRQAQEAIEAQVIPALCPGACRQEACPKERAWEHKKHN